MNFNIKQAWVNLSTSCNNNCIWCYAQKHVNIGNDISLDNFEKTVDFLVKINCSKVILVGGEPTLYNDLFRAIDYIIKSDLTCVIISNGRRFENEKFADAISIYREYVKIVISIEGTEKTHNSITNANSYANSIQGITNCLKKNIDLSISTTICEKNKNNIMSLYKELISLGVINYSLNFAIPPHNCDYSQKDYVNITSLNYILKKIRNVIYKNGLNFIFITPLPICIFDGEILDDIISNKIAFNNHCHMYSGIGIAFDYEANIIPCTHLMDINFGNILEMSNISDFWKLWTFEIEKKFRKKIRRYPSKKCNDCNLSYLCIGGCPIFWTHENMFSDVFS